jgi:hypothetical protein
MSAMLLHVEVSEFKGLARQHAVTSLCSPHVHTFTVKKLYGK